MTEPPGRWAPAVGDRVLVRRTGRRGTLTQVADTEWGFLCEVTLDAPASATGVAGRGAREVHASGDLAPLAPE